MFLLYPMTQGYQEMKTPNLLNYKLGVELLCDPVGIRTQDPQLRRLLLYPAELPGHRLRVQRYGIFLYEGATCLKKMRYRYIILPFWVRKDGVGALDGQASLVLEQRRLADATS